MQSRASALGYRQEDSERRPTERYPRLQDPTRPVVMAQVVQELDVGCPRNSKILEGNRTPFNLALPRRPDLGKAPAQGGYGS